MKSKWFKIIGIVWISCHLHFNSKWYNIGLVWFMLFNGTFNNVSTISWWSVLLVEETGVPGENHRPASSHWQTLSHNIVSSTSRLNEVRTQTLVVIDTDNICSCKSNHHTITTGIFFYLCCSDATFGSNSKENRLAQIYCEWVEREQHVYLCTAVS
jgi:hypothetical protein